MLSTCRGVYQIPPDTHRGRGGSVLSREVSVLVLWPSPPRSPAGCRKPSLSRGHDPLASSPRPLSASGLLTASVGQSGQSVAGSGRPLKPTRKDSPRVSGGTRVSAQGQEAGVVISPPFPHVPLGIPLCLWFGEVNPPWGCFSCAFFSHSKNYISEQLRLIYQVQCVKHADTL